MKTIPPESYRTIKSNSFNKIELLLNWTSLLFSIVFYNNLITVNQYLHRKDALSVALLEDKPSFGAGDGIRTRTQLNALDFKSKVSYQFHHTSKFDYYILYNDCYLSGFHPSSR